MQLNIYIFFKSEILESFVKTSYTRPPAFFKYFENVKDDVYAKKKCKKKF